jgi:DNA replication protein DnaC
MANRLEDFVNKQTIDALKTIADAQHKAVDEQKAKRDRPKMMGDVIRQYSNSGNFKRDTKIRWTLPNADILLMRGLAYAIGPTAQWLPEYDGVVEWLADNQGKGLMCIGDCGRGKTIITRDILPVIFKRYITIQYSDGWVGHPPYNYFLAKELKSRWAEIERCKVICVDDVGTEPIAKVYGETHNYFSELVDLCNDRDKLLICSTNLTQAQLFGGEEDGVVYPARCDQRTYSRLVGNTTRVYFEGEDLRIK